MVIHRISLAKWDGFNREFRLNKGGGGSQATKQVGNLNVTQKHNMARWRTRYS